MLYGFGLTRVLSVLKTANDELVKFIEVTVLPFSDVGVL